MYKDPIIIYREYIQNACDAIDQAVREGLDRAVCICLLTATGVM